MSETSNTTVNPRSTATRDTLALVFEIDWEYVDVIRTFVNQFLQKALVDHKVSDRISMAISELLENAVKYGQHDDKEEYSSIHMQLDMLKKHGKAVFFIENRSVPENIEVLKDQLEKVNEGSPREMYMKQIQASLLVDDKSQLGLARIRYEAAGEISLQVKKGNRVRIKVIFDTHT